MFWPIIVLHQIKMAFRISGTVSYTYSWISEKLTPGAQIDLNIDRRDQIINLCEIKYSTNEYTITKEYNDKIRNKIAVFENQSKTKKTIFFTMITTIGLVDNAYKN